MSKIKNIIIFLAIGAIFVLIYVFFVKPKPPVTTLVSSPLTAVVPNAAPTGTNGQITQDFLDLLLSVKNIKLNDAIFSDNAFASLHDSSIVLTPDATTGRINPFAQFGVPVPSLPAPSGEVPNGTLPNKANIGSGSIN